MQLDCTNHHYDDHVQANGLTPREVRQQKTDYRAKTFQQLERFLNPNGETNKMSAARFAEWLDEHGYKTFPDMPPYVS